MTFITRNECPKWQNEGSTHARVNSTKKIPSGIIDMHAQRDSLNSEHGIVVPTTSSKSCCAAELRRAIPAIQNTLHGQKHTHTNTSQHFDGTDWIVQFSQMLSRVLLRARSVKKRCRFCQEVLSLLDQIEKTAERHTG